MLDGPKVNKTLEPERRKEQDKLNNVRNAACPPEVVPWLLTPLSDAPAHENGDEEEAQAGQEGEDTGVYYRSQHRGEQGPPDRACDRREARFGGMATPAVAGRRPS